MRLPNSQEGCSASWWLLGERFALPPVSFIATVPGSGETGVALVAEAVISLVLMLAILEVSNNRRCPERFGPDFGYTSLRLAQECGWQREYFT